jgi:hypothetical protein
MGDAKTVTANSRKVSLSSIHASIRMMFTFLEEKIVVVVLNHLLNFFYQQLRWSIHADNKERRSYHGESWLEIPGLAP